MNSEKPTNTIVTWNIPAYAVKDEVSFWRYVNSDFGGYVFLAESCLSGKNEWGEITMHVFKQMAIGQDAQAQSVTVDLYKYLVKEDENGEPYPWEKMNRFSQVFAADFFDAVNAAVNALNHGKSVDFGTCGGHAIVKF